ncbi:hypothetical protein N7G274_008478 [Stereocaulon virgatum]|uniref:Uncharacterized protein n=1 Tax=Stereocaulon virgatum TaxID=373712 RepID=A0ABR3ZYL4_9LECA
MPRDGGIRPVSSDAGGYSDREDDFFILDSGDDFTKWDPNNEQHKYRRPSTNESIATSVRHTWAHPSVENIKNAAKVIAEELGPVVKQRVGKAAEWLQGAATRFTGSTSTGSGNLQDSDSDRGYMSAPEAFDVTNFQEKGKHRALLSRQDTSHHEWQPEPNAFNTGHMQASTSEKGTKRPTKKEVDTSREQKHNSGLTDRKEKQPNSDAECSHSRHSTRKDVPSDSKESHTYKTYATETRMERRARIKKEWEEK